MTFRTRFAPSPTGPLHLGHAYSALLAHDMARAREGKFLLRLEDIDISRSRDTWAEAIFDDLGWLGITWDETVLRQSRNLEAYRAALDRLWKAGLLYVCTCRRRDIQAAAAAPQEGGAPLIGPDGIVYPGTCRPARATPQSGAAPGTEALRLNLVAALDHLPARLSFVETGASPASESGKIGFAPDTLLATAGDVVLARRDMGTSYHLSVVVDDAAQEISDVVRGRDLFEATPVHVVLQTLLGLPVPRYHHHRLIRDAAGKRLAKRDDARALATYRAAGLSPADIRAELGLAEPA